jgi:hypothetical protein
MNEDIPVPAHNCALEPWWCWECANLGIIPDDDPGALDSEPLCPCCETYDHDWDAEQPPPCHKP